MLRLAVGLARQNKSSAFGLLRRDCAALRLQQLDGGSQMIWLHRCSENNLTQYSISLNRGLLVLRNLRPSRPNLSDHLISLQSGEPSLCL